MSETSSFPPPVPGLQFLALFNVELGIPQELGFSHRGWGI
jgi:hypothetical protein